MSWPTVPAAELMLKRGGSVNPANYPDETFELLSIPAFDKGEPEIVEGKAIGSSKSCVQPNDVLLSKIVPHIKRCWVVPAPQGTYRQIGSGEWIIFRSDKVHPPFLRHFLTSDIFHKQFMNTTAGVGGSLVRARPAEVGNIEIPLPPLPEQKRIAAILDKADAIRRKRQQAIQLADDFLRAVFLDMFGDPVTNPKGWETFALADVVRKDSIITYGIVQAGEHVDGGVPYIRTGDFKDGKLVRSGYACTSADIASKFKRSEVAPGDIVYCIRASVGSADIVPAFLAGANLTQGTAKISPAHDMKAEFLVELLRSAGFRSWIDKNSKGATFKEITLARLREAPVFKPPMFEQEAFIRIKKTVIERLAGKFQEADVPLFESLSQKAFSGQL